MNFIPKIYFKIIFDQNYVNSYNINFILNLEIDINIIKNFLNDINNEVNIFQNCLDELFKLLNLFLKKEFEYYKNFDDQKHSISKKEFVQFLKRYKDSGKKILKTNNINELDIKNFINSII